MNISQVHTWMDSGVVDRHPAFFQHVEQGGLAGII
jgi:hypothetical protein